MILNASGVPLAGSEQKKAAERAQGIFAVTLQTASLAGGDLNDILSVATNLILHTFQQIPPEQESKFIAEVMGSMQQAFTLTAGEKRKFQTQQEQLGQAIREAANKPKN